MNEDTRNRTVTDTAKDLAAYATLAYAPYYGIRCVSECRVSGEVLGSVSDSSISRVFVHCNLLIEGLFSLYGL